MEIITDVIMNVIAIIYNLIRAFAFNVVIPLHGLSEFLNDLLQNTQIQDRKFVYFAN